jgi:hypothetical protein
MENAVIARESRLLENKSKEKLNSFRTNGVDKIQLIVRWKLSSSLSSAAQYQSERR